MHPNLQGFCVAVHRLEGLSSCWPALGQFVSQRILPRLHRRMDRQQPLHLMRPLHPLGTLSLGRLHQKARLRLPLHPLMLLRRLLSQNLRVRARFIPPRQLMTLHPRHRLHQWPRPKQRSLPLHQPVVGPRRRLHLSLRARLLLLSLHPASSTWHPPLL